MTDDLVKRLQWWAFKFCGKGEQENLASDAMSEAAARIEILEEALQKIETLELDPRNSGQMWVEALRQIARAAIKGKKDD